MVKVFLHKEKKQPAAKEAVTDQAVEADLRKIIFFVYVRWSRENREMKTYMRSENLKSEIDMICSGLSDLVADPVMRLNSKNIAMAVLYQLNDDHDVSVSFDVTGIVPTRLHHYLNSDPARRIAFTQEQIDAIVNNTEFVYRAI